MSALHRKLLRDLWRIRTQALAIAALVACGVATVIMTFGALHSLLETRTAYYERYRFAEIFAQVKRAPNRVADQALTIPGVKAVQTRIVQDVTLDIPGFNEPATGRLVSVPEDRRPILNNLALQSGRWPEAGRPDEVLLADALADAHGLRPGNTLGAIINGHKRRLHVVGTALSPEFVYTIGPGTLVPDDERFGVLWMGREALAAAYDMDGAFNNITLTLLRGAVTADVIDRLDRLLARYGSSGAYDREDQVSYAYLKGELDQLSAIGRVWPPIFLGVAVFLLNIVVSRLVDTEREQIGLLKACGYGKWRIAGHYLEFVLAITLMGVLGGVLLGGWLGRLIVGLYADFFRFPFLAYHFSPKVYLAASLIAVAAASLATLGAVGRAARLAPAVAMQPPVPPSFHHGWLDRLFTLARLSQSSRMIGRHIINRPLRAGLTVLGLSMGGGLLVCSLFFYDAVEHMIDTYFHRSQRQDATINFVEPAMPAALNEVRRMPGVLAAEPFRQIAGRLVLGPRSERTALTGIDPDSDLYRILDRDLRPVTVPSHGLILSEKMAELLGAGRGSLVTVEVLEGHRPVVEMPVSAVISTYIGAPVYLDRHRANRLMRESGLISGSYVLIDRAREDALYRELKNLPQVAGISLQSANLRTFRNTMAEFMDIIVSVYVAFAGLIAFGVAYNAGRIALAERSRELASLKVLGFRDNEVSYILLGELAILTLAALPVGCLVGYALSWLLASVFDSELYRVPLIIEPSTYGASISVVLAASAVCAVLIHRRIVRLDMISVLKTRE